ncbi:MAG: TonB-dependent receptor [Pseudomonadota bacterium]
MLCCGANAAPLAAGDNDFVNLSLEELGNLHITSVSKRAERLADAPAAVFVIGADDVRRAGATSLREALRLAPNLQVQQVSAGGYTVTARGFANNDGNKLLVLIDGRSVYTPLFSGVFWDAQDVALDDVERIEVISGPGGTLWGTNAVNGVINVITRSARDTLGVLLTAGVGAQLKDGSVRYGAALGRDGAYRIYAKRFSEADTADARGMAVGDAWHKSQIGFRADWAGGRDQFTLQGDAYRARKGQPAPGTISLTGYDLALGDIDIGGADLLARWGRQLDDGASVSLQAYYDRTERTVPPTFAETLDTVDMQAQYALAPLGAHALALGAQYRYTKDHSSNSHYIAFLPTHRRQSASSLFAQDEVGLSPSLRLTLGLRLERNAYTGLEWLPNARLAWQTGTDGLLWGAVSRTVRAPSRLDRDTFVPGVPPFVLEGGANFQSEVARVLELGYRGHVADRLSYSVNLYRAWYDRLHTQELAASRTQVYFGNGMRGATSGIETWGSFQASANWRVSAGWSALHEKLGYEPGSVDTADSISKSGHDPAHMLMLRSAWQLTAELDLDASLRRVAALSSPEVPAYSAIDMRIGWRPRPGLELSLSGRNLFGPGHAEFTDISTRSQFERSVFARLTSRF